MRKIDKIINFDAERFKRVVGVKPATFQVMVEEYKAFEIERKKHIKLEVESLNYVKKIESFLCLNIIGNIVH